MTKRQIRKNERMTPKCVSIKTNINRKLQNGYKDMAIVWSITQVNRIID